MTSEQLANKTSVGFNFVNNKNNFNLISNNSNNNNNNNNNNNSSYNNSMLVNTNNNNSNNFKANKYIEGQSFGRGKHLTQPSWVDNNNNNDSNQNNNNINNNIDTSNNNTVTNITTSANNDNSNNSSNLKRKSRFGCPVESVEPDDKLRTAIPNPDIFSDYVPEPIIKSTESFVTGPVLKGFVRSTTSYETVAKNTLQQRQQQQDMFKKRRWDI